MTSANQEVSNNDDQFSDYPFESGIGINLGREAYPDDDGCTFFRRWLDD